MRESDWQAVRKAAEAAVDRFDVSEEDLLKQDFAQVEQIVLEEMRKVGLELLRTRLRIDPRARAEREFQCSRCQGRLRIQEGEQARRLETVVGEVEYRRPYGVCDRCGISYAPLDCGLGIPASGGSVRRTERVCHAAVNARSFESAAEILKEHDGLELSAKQARVIAEAEGERLAEERKREAEAFRQGELTFPAAPAVELLVVTADGGRLQTRQSENGTAWKEDKVGGVYDADPRKDPTAAKADEYEGARAKTKTYTASLVPWEDFGWMLCVEAWRRGYERAKQKLFISDGAGTLKTLRELHFRDAVFVLDWYHAAQHLADCAKAAFGEGTDECARWYERLKEKLWLGEIDAILRSIERESLRVGKPTHKEPDGSPRLVLHRNLGYFAENRKGMDYPRFRAEGWPIGSGIAEGAVKQFGMRMKGTEKFWNGLGFGNGAEEMLALCALHRSEDGRWRTYWGRRARPYTREPKVPGA
jgi:hypothetical protein